MAQAKGGSADRWAQRLKDLMCFAQQAESAVDVNVALVVLVAIEKTSRAVGMSTYPQALELSQLVRQGKLCEAVAMTPTACQQHLLEPSLG